MKHLLLLLFIINTGLVQAQDTSQPVVTSREFQVVGYACFQNTLMALSGTIHDVTRQANQWCESLNGQLDQFPDSKKIDIEIISGNTDGSGCSGNVILSAEFNCIVR